MTTRLAYLRVFAAMLPLLAGSCASSSGVPRDRLGSLPFPGSFTLYRVADPDNLGQHYSNRTPRLFGPNEARGIVYTRRAGFLDLAHIRITVDTVRYCTDRIREAIQRKKDVVALTTIEGSIFYVTLHPPSSWSSGDEQERLISDEVAIRTGQRVAYLMMTWHEMITWYGYRAMPFIRETQSSFTYDDPMSHVVGLSIAGRVLRQGSERSFDEDVTRELRAELADLGVVSSDATKQAVRAVDGIWWARGIPLKRQLDVDLASGTVRPWLVPSMDSSNAEPQGHLQLPSLKDVHGRDFSEFYSVTIDPRISVAGRIREALPSRPALLDADRDFPVLLEVTRRQMRERLAMDVDKPWPTPDAEPASAGPHNLVVLQGVTTP